MTGEMEEFKRPLYQLLDYRSVLYNEILYQPYDTRIFEGILFYKERTEEYLGGISMNS